MIEEINELKKELDSYLDNKKEIDDNSLEKKLYSLIKAALTNKISTIEIGNYYLNLDPKELKVTYESLSTYLEVSNHDIYEEFELIDNCFYYVIKNSDNDYNENSPVIKVSNTILMSSPYYSENLYFELINADNIKDYMKDNSLIKYEGNKMAIVNKYFSPSDNRLNEQDFLNLEKVMLVKKQLNGSYKPTYREEKDSYNEILPNLEINKKIINKIYNCLVDFYKKYL